MIAPVVIEEGHAMVAWAKAAHARGQRIALVPTMGYLHAGHLSLVHQARQHADVVVVSIFVNPTQFGPREDLDTYPRDLPSDIEKLAALDVEAVFCPTREVIYPEGFDTYVVPGRLANGLCGASRPNHFRGVATVVHIFFRLTRCDIAVFGEKDFQQLQIIRRMTRDLCLDVQIVGAPIVREADGLAMSSRNTYLSADERQQAVVLWRALERAATLVAGGQRRAATVRDEVLRTMSSAPLARVDYIDIVDPDTLQPLRTIEHQAVCALAVHFGSTRLIDNRRLTLAEPVTSS